MLPFLKTVKFLCSLVIKIFPVHNKNNLVHFWKVSENLGGLERSKGLTRTGCVPDIAELTGSLNSFDEGFHSKKLVGPEYHKNLSGFVKHHVFGYHFSYMAGFQKDVSKVRELGDKIVIYICPVESLFE